MKRLVSLFFASVFLFSCAGNDLNLVNSNSIVNTQSIEIKHDQNLSDFIKFFHKQIFNSYDKNKDTFLSPQELNNGKLFEELDLDKNGKVSRKEAFLGSSSLFNNSNKEIIREIVSQLFNNIDINKNKKIDRKEYLDYLTSNDTSKEKVTYLKTLFTKNDLNKDDLLTFSEFEDAIYQLWKKDMKFLVDSDGTLIIIFPSFKILVKF